MICFFLCLFLPTFLSHGFATCLLMVYTPWFLVWLFSRLSLLMGDLHSLFSVQGALSNLLICGGVSIEHPPFIVSLHCIFDSIHSLVYFDPGCRVFPLMLMHVHTSRFLFFPFFPFFFFFFPPFSLFIHLTARGILGLCKATVTSNTFLERPPFQFTLCH